MHTAAASTYTAAYTRNSPSRHNPRHRNVSNLYTTATFTPLKNINTVTVVTTPSPIAANPSPCVTKPPVDTVLHATHNASTTPTPCAASAAHIAAVTNPYTAHILATLLANLGCSLLCCVPLNSASYNPAAPNPSLRNTATTNNSRPNPPTHCVIALYTRIDPGSNSGLCTTDEPVVVKPLNDSNTASVTDPTTPVVTYGNAPNSGTTTHTTTVSQ